MSTLAQLCVQAPVITHGRSSGIADWNLSVEMAMPSDASSILGSFTLGTSKLASKSWYDVTDKVRGIHIERGGSPGDRPEPGTASIELDNTTITDFSPWTSDDYFLGSENVFLGPGTLVRVVAHDTSELDADISNIQIYDFSTSQASVQTSGEYWFSFVNGTNQTSVSYIEDLTGASINMETASFPATAVGFTRDCYFGVFSGTNALYFIWQESGILACTDVLAGVSTTVEVPGARHKHWQLRETSGAIYFETSYDGLNWQTQRTISTPAWITSCRPVIFTNVNSALGNLTAANGWHIKNVNSYQLASAWQPLFTGIVEQWDTATEALERTGSLTVTAIDTMSTLAQVDDNAVTPVGVGESPNTRIQRLADAASWKYGTLLEYGGPARTFQSTDLSMNRIAEMYLVADSVDELIKSGRDGRIMFGQRDARYVDSANMPEQITHGGPMFFTGVLAPPRLYLGSASHAAHGNWVPASPDDFKTANNDDLIIGSVSLARVGGTAVTTDSTYNLGRYQRRTYNRSDFITQNPGSDADLTYVANRILDRSDQTYRPDSVHLDGKRDDKVIQVIFTMDVGCITPIYTDHVTFFDYTICSYTIDIAPLNDNEMDIRADLRFEPNTVSSWARV